MSEPKGSSASAGFLPLLVSEWRSNRILSLPLLQSLGETQLSKKDLYPPFALPYPCPVLSCDPALKRVQVKNTQLGWTSAETDLLSVSQGVSKRTPSLFSNPRSDGLTKLDENADERLALKWHVELPTRQRQMDVETLEIYANFGLIISRCVFLMSDIYSVNVYNTVVLSQYYSTCCR